MRHTSAPWMLDLDVGPDAFPVVVDTSGRYDIAFVREGLSGSPDEIVANGHLIAASPVLLAVCEAYEQWEADLVLAGDAWDWDASALPRIPQRLWDRLIEIQEQRNEALAKARPR